MNLTSRDIYNLNNAPIGTIINTNCGKIKSVLGKDFPTENVYSLTQLNYNFCNKCCFSPNTKNPILLNCDQIDCTKINKDGSFSFVYFEKVED